LEYYVGDRERAINKAPVRYDNAGESHR
jgi:hypothetical protein